MPSKASLEIRDRGFIIRTLRYSETSLIVEWLTESHGRVNTMARGALRKKSAFQGKLDLLFFSLLSYQQNRRSDLHQLKEVSLLSSPQSLRRSIARLNLIAYFIDLIRRTTETDTPTPEVFALFHQAITIVEATHLGPQFLLWFEWKLLGILGIQPNLDDPTLPQETQSQLRQWTETNEADIASLRKNAPITALASLLSREWVREIGKCPKLRGTLLSPLPNQSAS